MVDTDADMVAQLPATYHPHTAAPLHGGVLPGRGRDSGHEASSHVLEPHGELARELDPSIEDDPQRRAERRDPDLQESSEHDSGTPCRQGSAEGDS